MEIDNFLIALATIGCAFAYIIYWLWFLPMNRVRRWYEVGYNHLVDGKKDRKSIVNRQRRLRKPGSTPPPFPNGWYVIVESEDIKKGEVKEVHALGEHFAVFRGTDEDSNTALVTDLYCPHLGASFGSGGIVSGNCITCPFHNWKFDGKSGECVDIPYAKKAPRYGKVKTWKSIEVNGLVYVWYHAENVEPYWNPIKIPEINPTDTASKQWVYRGRNEFEVTCHIEDIPENGADVGHLPAIHTDSIFSGGEPTKLSSLASMWGWHEYSVTWKPKTITPIRKVLDEDISAEEEYDNQESDDKISDEKHLAIVELNQKFKIFGNFTLFTTKVHGQQIGPATVHLHMEIPELGLKGVFLQYVLPIEPLLQKVVHVFYTEPRWPAPFAKFTLWGESILVERDITIWNNKMYASKPTLATKEDRLLKQHRLWYSQFYSENSKTRQEANNNTLEW